MTLDEFGRLPSSIPLYQLLNAVDTYTERVMILVIIGSARRECEEAKRMHDFCLTNDAFAEDEEGAWKELERLLKYYADAPVWNLRTKVCEDAHTLTYRDRHNRYGDVFGTTIVANVYYKDIREGYLAEKLNRQRERKAAYRQRKKEKQDD